MSQFDANKWASTSVEENNPAPEPGTYEALLHDARAFTSNAGKDFVVLSWRVASGPEAGYEWDDLRGFGSDGAIKATKATLIRIGVDVDALTSLDEMDRAVQGAVGEWYVLEVKQNGDFRNTFVNQKISAPASNGSDINSDTTGFEPEPVAAGVKTDSIPF